MGNAYFSLHFLDVQIILHCHELIKSYPLIFKESSQWYAGHPHMLQRSDHFGCRGSSQNNPIAQKKVPSCNFGARKVGLTEPGCTLSTLRVDTHSYHLCHCSMCTHFNKGLVTFGQTTNLKKCQQLMKKYNEFWFRSLIALLL